MKLQIGAFGFPFLLLSSGFCQFLLLFSSSVDGILMSFALGVNSSSANMGFDEDKQGTSANSTEGVNAAASKDKEMAVIEPSREKFARQMSEDSILTTEDDDDEDTTGKIDLGPQCSLKAQLEKDKVFYFFNYPFYGRNATFHGSYSEIVYKVDNFRSYYV